MRPVSETLGVHWSTPAVVFVTWCGVLNYRGCCWVVVDFIVDDFGFGELEDYHSSWQHKGEQGQRQGLPGLQSNEGQGQGH